MNFKCCTKNSAEQKNLGRVYDFLKLISDKNRLKIICLLREEPKCVCKIFRALGISQKLASHHLGQLKKIGLLDEKRDGNFIYYGLNKDEVNKHKLIFNQIIKA